MKSRLLLTCSLAVALTALLAGSAICAKPKVIQVSDQLDLKDTKSTIVSGETCLPVRQVAEAMGGNVSWDVKSGVLTVTGNHGTALLRLGDNVATINGRRVSYRVAPFMHLGRLYAPLRFYNDFFYTGLQWDPALHAYRWIWILPPAPYQTPEVIYGPGSQSPPSGTQRTVAEVESVNPDAWTIAATIANHFLYYSVSRDAMILRGAVGGRAVEVPLSEVRPGDRATLQLNDSGVVTMIRAQYQEIRGVVASISDDSVTLESGRKLSVSDQTQVVLPGNAGGSLKHLSIGDQVIASIGPLTGDTYLIAVQPASSSGEQQANISLNTYGPMNVGDILRVTVKASPGAKASFTIPGVANDIKMVESAPGVYSGQYSVQPGDALPGQPIRITLVTPQGNRFEALSAKSLTIVTDSQYLPRIVSPKAGEDIASPIVVSGIADPGAEVQVSVEFRRNILGMMPIEGLSDTKTVKAGANGVWKTEPMAATAPFHDVTTEFPYGFGELQPLYKLTEDPTTFVITATEMNATGAAGSSYSVEVRVGHGENVGL